MGGVVRGIPGSVQHGVRPISSYRSKEKEVAAYAPPSVSARSWPQAAAMSAPLLFLSVAV